MNTNKKVLIAEPNEVLRNGMKNILEGAGFGVVEAENGKEALNLFAKESFDLVVSDVEMPEMDGLQLLEKIKAQSACRFLMISDFSSALQSRQALQLGADEFINKPFSKTDFLQATESALATPEGDNGQSLEAEFVQVPLSDFITGTTLKVDIYIRLSAIKFLKIGHKGGLFSPDRVQKYVAKGIRWFFMRKEDFAFYVGFNIDLAQAAHTASRIETGKKLRLTMHVTETLIAQLKNQGLGRDQLDDATNVVNNAVEMISMNPSTLKLLESLEVCGTLPAHSIATAIWSCLIARQLEWAGQCTYFKLAVSALFHDVGQKEMDGDTIEKQRFEMTREERKHFESHTLRGRDILLSVPGMPEDAATVALQHHELVSGAGYPYQLKMHFIHPLARLISVADRFCELVKAEGTAKGLNFKAIYALMLENAKDFDPTFLEALGQIIENAEIAKETSPRPEMGF